MAGSLSSERPDELFRRDNRPGVVGGIELERGLHLVPAVARDGILHQGDLVPQLRRVANGRVDAGVRAQADHDQLVNAVFLELQIEVRVGEPTRAPVLKRHDLPRLRRELDPKGAAPGAVGEDLRARPGFLDRGPEFPLLVVADAPAMMRREEDLNARGTSRLENLDHVRDASVRFRHFAHSRPQLSAIRDEVIVGIDHQQSRPLQSKRYVDHDSSPLRSPGSLPAGLSRASICRTFHRFPYCVNTSSRAFAIVWHARPHLASFPCGGSSLWVAGVNVFDAALYLNAPHPYPPLSANLLLSFTWKSTSCRFAGTIVVGNGSSFFGIQWIFAILEPSGNGLPLPGIPDW